MRKITTFVLAFIGMVLFVACSDTETYADQVETERKAIESYINSNGIKVISEAQFIAAGEVTDTAKNEFVLFENSGVYMQIMRKGVGEKIKSGENTTVLCRYKEWNLLNNPDMAYATNETSALPDIMYVSNTSGTFQATFDTTAKLYLTYASQSGTTVPTGWLLPLTYVKVGRAVAITDEIAKVRIIVPHDKGHEMATRYVYPCLYEITYERGR